MKNLTTFKNRKISGDIGEYIVFTAFQKNIIPNKGSIEMFSVLEEGFGTIEEIEDSKQHNLVNGDMGFLGLNMARCKVDVKCGDWISERSLTHIDDGNYFFLNAYPGTKTTGLPFMFKVDHFVKDWIRKNCVKDYDEVGKPIYRILRYKLMEFLPDHYEYKFDVKLCEKHRTECLIEAGVLNP